MEKYFGCATVFLALCCLQFGHSYKIAASLEESDKNEAEDFLVKYGYLGRKFTSGDVKRGLKNFQHFANLRISGELDEPTVKMMKAPRCGMKDPQVKVHRRMRRYNHEGSRWSKLKLTWSLENRGRTLDRETVLETLRMAFKMWQDVTNLDFIETDHNDVDIVVKFTPDVHEDVYPFRGTVLAHAFYPFNNKGLSGDVHFRDSVDYSVRSERGKNLLWVATHEIGHSIGLEHSNIQKAVMYPWYQAYKPGFKLHYDDQLGIQSLYGARSQPTTSKPQPTTPQTTPKTIPQNPSRKIKAAFRDNRNNRHVFIMADASLYYLVDGQTYADGPYAADKYFKSTPGPLQTRVGSARNQVDPTSISAAFTSRHVKNGEDLTLLFEQDSYYIYDGTQRGGPYVYRGSRASSYEFNLPNIDFSCTLDAVMYDYPLNGRTYFFCGNQFWRFDNENNRIDAGYPKVISQSWGGVPDYVDASFVKDQRDVYFIKGEYVYKLERWDWKVEEGYPKHICDVFISC